MAKQHGRLMKGLDLASSANSARASRPPRGGGAPRGYGGGSLPFSTGLLDQGERHLASRGRKSKVTAFGKALTTVYPTPKKASGSSGSGVVGAV